MLSRGLLGPMEVVAEYVRHGQIDQVRGTDRVCQMGEIHV